MICKNWKMGRPIGDLLVGVKFESANRISGENFLKIILPVVRPEFNLESKPQRGELCMWKMCILKLCL
jgi:hypothetical protein